jgi:hypothetical protein
MSGGVVILAARGSIRKNLVEAQTTGPEAAATSGNGYYCARLVHFRRVMIPLFSPPHGPSLSRSQIQP